MDDRQGTQRLGGEWWWLDVDDRYMEVRRRVVVVGRHMEVRRRVVVVGCG